MVLTADSGLYRDARKRTGSLLQAVRGELDPYKDGVHGDEVAKGIVYNYKEKKFTLQGRLSNEVVDSI